VRHKGQIRKPLGLSVFILVPVEVRAKVKKKYGENQRRGIIYELEQLSLNRMLLGIFHCLPIQAAPDIEA